MASRLNAVSAQSIGSATSVVSPTFTSTTGSLLAVVAGGGSNTITNDAISDNGTSNTWSNAVASTAGGALQGHVGGWYSKNINGRSGHTVTDTATSDFLYIGVEEWSGIDTVAPLLLHPAVVFGTSTNPHNAAAASPGAGDVVIFGGLQLNSLANNNVFTASGGTATIDAQTDSTTNQPGAIGSDVAAGGSVTYGYTLAPNDSVPWSIVVMTFKVAGGGMAAPKRLPYQLLGSRIGRVLGGSAVSTLQTQRILARGWRPFPAVAAGVLDALATTATGVGNVTAALSVKHNLATTTTGVGATTAALSVKHALATTATGVGATTAALSVKHNLATSATGVGATSAALSVKHNLATGLTGIGVVTAALSVTHNLAVGNTGVGRVTAGLTSVHLDALADTPTGVGRVTAALTLQHLLAVTVVGVANASAALSGGVAVQGGDIGTGWYRRQRQQQSRPRPPATVPGNVVRLAVRVRGSGVVVAALTVWSPTYTREELIAISHLVDADELAALMAI